MSAAVGQDVGDLGNPSLTTMRRDEGAAIGSDGRIALVVEDEAAIRQVLSRVLTRAGWRVLLADSAEAAWALLTALGSAADSQLSVVISDMVMPGMDGYALVRVVRRIRPGLPAILVSGYLDPLLARDLAAENIAFLAKPYRVAAMRDLLSRVTTSAARTMPETTPDIAVR
jgi:CheY-like chemotaxis protein